MPIGKRGAFEDPRKSAWSFEAYDSDLERRMMKRLEADPAVRKWTKKHGVSIGWLDDRHRRHAYRPDFLVEYANGDLALIEVKAAGLVESPSVQRKRKAAELWCRRRDMQYEIATIE